MMTLIPAFCMRSTTRSIQAYSKRPSCGSHRPSSWGLWEPQDGRFEYAWMDRVVDRMQKAGIKVIMGTPTYSVPAWMYKEHPEIVITRFGGQTITYGYRQNTDLANATYRFYCERIIRKLLEHYKNNPTVIGWQIDNETSAGGAANSD